MKLPKWLSGLFMRMSSAAKAAFDRWVAIFNSEKKLFVADLMAASAAAIKEASTSNLSGEEKRKRVQNALIGVATRHALVIAGKIATAEIQNLVNWSIESQVMTMKANKEIE